MSIAIGFSKQAGVARSLGIPLKRSGRVAMHQAAQAIDALEPKHLANLKRWRRMRENPTAYFPVEAARVAGTAMDHAGKIWSELGRYVVGNAKRSVGERLVRASKSRQVAGLAKQAGVKRLGRILASAAKRETPELVEVAGRAAQKVMRRADRVNSAPHRARVSGLTGRMRFLHGTGLEEASAIRSKGLLPSKETGRLASSGDFEGPLLSRMRSVAFGTTSQEIASRSAMHAPALKKTVRVDAKVWGDGAQRKINPWISSGVRSHLEGAGPGRAARRTAGRALRGYPDMTDVAFERIHPRYIEGSKDFQPMTGREVVDHAKAHPERVRGGLKRLTRRSSG